MTLLLFCAQCRPCLTRWEKTTYPSLITSAYRYDQNVLLSKRYIIFVLSLNKTSVITLF
ncbi:hypothetical protein SPRA44_350104 [Serratia proteamaculans]|nr:hypothetical protein SPRA44_350104 [Serratia proteamaculans]